MSQKSVLFVCMGNICRSPAAEGVLRKFAADRGVAGEITIESAGTIGYHEGEPPDSRMRTAASRRGYYLDSRARRFRIEDFDRFDLIVAMDRENLEDLLVLDASGHCSHKLRLLCDFAPGSPVRDVPDPFYGGTKEFERVLDLIERACPHILDALFGKQENGEREKST